MAFDVNNRVSAPLKKFMGALNTINNYRKKRGDLGYTNGLALTYGNNIYLTTRGWSLGSGGEFAEIADIDENPQHIRFCKVAGIMGLKSYGDTRGLNSFIGTYADQYPTGAGVVALVETETLGEYMSRTGLDFGRVSQIYHFAGYGINAPDNLNTKVTWARGSGMRTAYREQTGGWCWAGTEPVNNYNDWLMIKSITYYSGDTLPRTPRPNKNTYPLILVGGSSYIGATGALTLYSVSMTNTGAGFIFNPPLPSANLIERCYYNDYSPDNLIQNFSQFLGDIVLGSKVYNNIDGSPTTLTMIDTEIMPSCYGCKSLYLSDYTDDTSIDNIAGGSAQTSAGYIVGLLSGNYPANRSVVVYPDMQSIIDMFADWGIVITDDVGVAESFPTSQVPSGDGQPPAGYDTNDSPTIDNYPDNSTVDFDIKKPLVNYNPAIDTNVMTSQGAGTLLQWLTTSTFLDNISRLFNEPLSAIIALRYYPFDIAAHDSANVTATTSTTIVNVTCDTVGGYKIGDGYNTRVAGGSMEYTAYYGSFADWTNCRYQLYIPYVGIVDIAPSYVINRRLSLEYIVDFLSGKTTAIVKSYDKDTNKGNIVLMRECSMSVDVPIVYSNYNQQQLTRTLSLLSGVQSVANGAVNGAMSGGGTGAAIGAVTGLLGGAASAAQTYATTPLEMGAIGTIGSSGGYNMPQTAYLMISRRPLALPAAEYANIAGKSAGVYDTIGAVSGFVKCECARVDINATEREKQEIMSLLANGVYV